MDGGFYRSSPKQEAQDLALARSLETLGWQGASCSDPKTGPLELPDSTLLTVQVLRVLSTSQSLSNGAINSTPSLPLFIDQDGRKSSSSFYRAP